MTSPCWPRTTSSSSTRPHPGVLSEPERVPHTASNPRLLKLVDLDGNGALDLVILDGGTDHPIHVRFATDEKKLGPEQRFQVERLGRSPSARSTAVGARKSSPSRTSQAGAGC